MKKLTGLFALFVLFTAFQCENESIDQDVENENNNNNVVVENESNADLIGDWLLLNMEADIVSETNFQGFDFTSEFQVAINESDYVVTFDESNYYVAGDYTVDISTTVNGETSSYTDSYTNVDGSGVYSTSGNVMTVDGTFVEFDFDGMPTELEQGEQMVNFQISGDGQTLTFTQDEVQETNEGGVLATTTTTSVSVWQRMD
ncbi:MAG: hypothetical protein HRU26_01070 [Psychroserpens sp.]|nr:hypothetical protein [Psychroserpens sp.]